MPTTPITDVSAGDRRAERRLLGIEHLVLALVLLALYAVAMLVALDPGALRACSGPDAGSAAGSAAGDGAPADTGSRDVSCAGNDRS